MLQTKITFEAEHIESEYQDKYWEDRITIKIREAGTVPEMLDHFKYFMLALGYHPNNVKCIQYVDDLEETEDE